MGNSTASKQHFVCPECESSIVPSEGQNGFLRCDKGHRLQILQSRPLWLTGLYAFVSSYWILSTVMHLTRTFLQRAYPGIITACLLVAAGASGVYLFVVALRYARRPAPLPALGRQYVAVSIGRLTAVALLAVLAWMRLPT